MLPEREPAGCGAAWASSQGPFDAIARQVRPYVRVLLAQPAINQTAKRSGRASERCGPSASHRRRIFQPDLGLRE